MQAAYMLQPGESFPAEASSSIASLAKATTFSTATTPTYTEEATTSAAVPRSVNSQPSPKGLSAGAIAGIAIGGAAVLLLGVALFFLSGRTKTLKEVVHNNQGEANRHSGPDMLHSNGAHFVPVTPAGYRKSGKGLGDVVSHQKPPEESIRANLSDHSTSPIVPYHNSLQFGNFYPQEALSNSQNMPQTQRFSNSSGFEFPHQPAVNSQVSSGGPHELSTPLMYDNRHYRPYRPTE